MEYHTERVSLLHRLEQQIDFIGQTSEFARLVPIDQPINHPIVLTDLLFSQIIIQPIISSTIQSIDQTMDQHIYQSFCVSINHSVYPLFVLSVKCPPLLPLQSVWY